MVPRTLPPPPIPPSAFHSPVRAKCTDLAMHRIEGNCGYAGTSITVRGSVIVSTDTNNVTDPTWTCSIDGIEIPSSTFQYAENNWPLCRQNQMASGAHTLTIQVKSKGQPFYIDGLSYTPPPEAVFPSAVLVYSDSDPALSYSAGWTEADGMSTQTAGSYVTLSFHGKRFHSF
jgi:hypothetical protein